jgi:uncharacterized membrane protein YfcA
MNPDLILMIPSFVALGAFVGFCAGLLGIGGGLILVPALYYLFKIFGMVDGGDDIFIHTALATSMAIILPTGISSSWAQIKRKAVDWTMIRLMTPGLMMGVICGIFLVTKMEGDVLKIIFAIGLSLIALSMIFKREHSKIFPILIQKKCAYPFSILFGIVAIFLGIGGAVMNVPYLNRAGIPLKSAIATGTVLGVIISFVATIGYVVSGDGALGYINIESLLMIVPASILMAPLGVKVSHALPVSKLRIILASLLVIVSINMIYEAFK